MDLVSEFDYECAKDRIEAGEKAILEKGGFLSAPKHWVAEFQKLAEAMLMYEIAHDLIPL